MAARKRITLLSIRGSQVLRSRDPYSIRPYLYLQVISLHFLQIFYLNLARVHPHLKPVWALAWFAAHKPTLTSSTKPQSNQELFTVKTYHK